MKLAIVSPYPPSKGTLNEYNYHLVKHFNDKVEFSRIDLITDTLPENKSYPENTANTKIKYHPSWNFNSYKTIFNIMKKIKELQPDVVLFNIQFLSFGDKKIPAALGLMLPMLLKWRGVKSVVLLHNILEEVDLGSAGISKNKILNYIFNLIGTFLTTCLLKADLLTVTISKYVEVLEKKYQKNNIALTPHGSFEIPPVPDFTYTKKPYSVMAFGKFGTYKKVEVMIDAVINVRKRTGMEIEVVIAGSDNPNSKGYLQSVKDKYADIPGLKFTGYIAEEDIPQLFYDSTVAVFPYTGTTGSSGILHQAGSYGKAVVLPNIGDLEKLIIEEGYVGEFFEPGDVNTLADAIEKVLVDDEYRMNLAEQNYMAATSLPLADIADWYYLHFCSILGEKYIPVQRNVTTELI